MQGLDREPRRAIIVLDHELNVELAARIVRYYGATATRDGGRPPISAPWQKSERSRRSAQSERKS